MRTSQFLLATLKETPADAEIISHQLMLRAGMIRKTASGIYSWLPIGMRVLSKVQQIIREEMTAAGSQEILLPAIQPAELWQESKRWDQYGKELIRLKDRHERDFCLGPTHEEVITDILRGEIKSFRQLPLNVFQIQTKFRDEIRPRFGVMRAREFIMKDAYSFHLDEASLGETYQKMYEAYQRIFTRLGLNFRPVRADTGSIGGDYSHEFQVLAATGEDTIVYSDESDYAANIELAGNVKEGDPSPDGKGHLKFLRGIEVGHIFQLGEKYSRAMNANVINEKGETVPLKMGCYGIGVTRVIAAGIEQNHDDKGIIWPVAMAPFQIVIVPIGYHQSVQVKETTDKIYKELLAKNIEVLLDDRDERPGVKFNDMDLIGIPYRLVIGEKKLAQGLIEFKDRKKAETQDIEIKNIYNFFDKIYQ